LHCRLKKRDNQRGDRGRTIKRHGLKKVSEASKGQGHLWIQLRDADKLRRGKTIGLAEATSAGNRLKTHNDGQKKGKRKGGLFILQNGEKWKASGTIIVGITSGVGAVLTDSERNDDSSPQLFSE